MAQLLCGNDGDLLCIRFLARCRLDLCRMGNRQWLFRLHSELDETQGKAFPGACRLSAYRIGRCGCAGTVCRKYIYRCMECLPRNAECFLTGAQCVRHTPPGLGICKGKWKMYGTAADRSVYLLVPANSKTMQEKFRPTWKSALYAAILLIACITQMNQVVQFLYFQF